MALTVLPQFKNPARSFVEFLIRRHHLKEGFESVLEGRDFSEIDEYLLSHRLIESVSLAEQYADFYTLPFIRLINLPILPSVLNLLPVEIALKYSVVPYKLEGTNLFLAVGDPSKLQRNAPSILTSLHRQKGLKVNLAIVPRSDIEAVLTKLRHQGENPLKPNIPTYYPTTNQQILSPTKGPAEVRSLNKLDLIKEVEPREKVVDLKDQPITAELLQKIPLPVAKRYQIVVFGQESPKGQFESPMIKIAMVHPDDPKSKEIVEYIENSNKVIVNSYSTTPESLQSALKLYPNIEHLPAEVEIKEEKTEVTPKPMPEPIKDQTPKVIQPTVNPASTSTSTVDSHATTKVQGGTEGLSLSSDDIINRPSLGETTEELQRLAKQQENSLESQNLDSLIKGPVTSVEELAKAFRNGVIPEIVAATLFLAIWMKASDVHIEALANAVRLRYRIDGILHDIISVPHFLHPPLISRIKILAKMKIDEQRIPQDVRFDVIIDNRQVDLRVSTLPTVHGEKIVMRLLDKSGGVLTLEQLGVTGTNFDALIANIAKPYGIIMSTGPTGSGKSTTLYAVLSRLSKPGVNIITLEDPVEYELPGVNQAQVKPQIGFTFAEGLRSVLRQDPNIIMVGEVRDLETAAM